jgi:hypothetical protein
MSDFMSRERLLRLHEEVDAALDGDEVFSDELGAGLVVATARCRLRCTAVRADEVYQAEIWLSPVGVVVLPTAADEHQEVQLTALPPSAAYVVLANVLDLPPDVTAGPAGPPPTWAGGLDALAASAADRSDRSVTELRVLDTLDGDGGLAERRLIVDTPTGRSGCWPTPDTDRAAPVELQPLSPWQLTVALSALIAEAVGPADPSAG